MMNSQSNVFCFGSDLIEHFALIDTVVPMGVLRRALLHLAFYIIVLVIGYFLLKVKRLHHAKSHPTPTEHRAS